VFVFSELARNFIFEAVIAKLRENHLHGLPVCDDGAYLGWVSWDDVAHGFLTVLGRKIPGELDAHDWTHSPDSITAKGQQFVLSPCSKLPRMTAWTEILDHGTLMQLMEEMHVKQIHRTGIVTEKNVLHSIISITDIIAFISEHHSLWKEFGRRSLGDLNLGSRNVISCSLSQEFLQALYLMDVNHVTGVAVTDASNQLIANLSSADLSALEMHTNTFVPTTFRSLMLPISGFLARTKGQPPVTARLDDELNNVVAQMAMFHVHRVWIVDTQKQPIGIVTAFDVLKLFL